MSEYNKAPQDLDSNVPIQRSRRTSKIYPDQQESYRLELVSKTGSKDESTMSQNKKQLIEKLRETIFKKLEDKWLDFPIDSLIEKFDDNGRYQKLVLVYGVLMTVFGGIVNYSLSYVVPDPITSCL